MRTAVLALTIALLAGSLPACADVPWIHDDIDEAFRQAKVKKLPLLVYFHTTWCSFCTAMEDNVFSDDEVTFQANAFITLRLNCDRREGQRLAHRYKVTTFPTVLALTPQGEILGRIAVYRAVPEFLRFLQEVQTPGDTLAAIDKRIDGGEKSAEILLRSAERHFEAGENDVSMHRYGEAIEAARAKGQSEEAVQGRLGLGRVRSMKGDSAGALEQYLAVLRNDPQSKQIAEAFVGALVILREENRGKEIDALFQEFGERFPDNPAVLNDHARRLIETGGQSTLALQKARKAVSLNPRSADYQATLARALRATHSPMEALETIGVAIALRPTDKDLRLLRLDILEDVKRPFAAPAAGPSPKAP